MGSLISRRVLAKGEERQQLKWFTYAAALMIFGFPATLILIGIPAVILFGGIPPFGTWAFSWASSVFCSFLSPWA